MRVCDFAWGAVPGRERELARALKAAGFGAVIRYLASDASKRLTRAEVAAYRAEGLHIVTVFEDSANGLLGGAAAGRSMALEAKRQLAALGAPEHAPVYFAADFPVTGGQLPAVDAALDATAVVLTEDLNGIYGDYEAVTGAKYVRYRWQTVAWSSGVWSPHASIRQFAIGGTTDSVQWDLDETMTADFGQWAWPVHHPLAPVKAKEKKVSKAVKKIAKAVHTTVVHKEPAVTAHTAAGGLAAAVALLATRVGWHLTATEIRAIVTALPAVATLYTALRTRPAATSAMIGAASTIVTAAAAFGAHIHTADLGALVPVITLLTGTLTSIRVSPKPPKAATPATALPPPVLVRPPAPAPIAPPPVPVPVAVPAATAATAPARAPVMQVTSTPDAAPVRMSTPHVTMNVSASAAAPPEASEEAVAGVAPSPF